MQKTGNSCRFVYTKISGLLIFTLSKLFSAVLEVLFVHVVRNYLRSIGLYQTLYIAAHLERKLRKTGNGPPSVVRHVGFERHIELSNLLEFYMAFSPTIDSM